MTRYPADRKAETRRRVIGEASRAFRRDGIAATGIVGLMGAAGLTQGGFYAHFASKEALVGAALEAAIEETAGWLAGHVAKARAAGRDGLEAIVSAYLDPRHLARPDRGCAMAAIGAEVARHSAGTRAIGLAAVARVVDVIAAEFPDGDRARATALFGLLAGTLQIARLAAGTDEADAILEAGRDAAMGLALRRPGMT